MEKQIRPRISESEYQLILGRRKNSPVESDGGGNVLIIGDQHEPFAREGYLEFCARTRDKYKCDKIVMIGDVIDNHYSSFHEPDPDGISAGTELELAIKKIGRWYKEFPKADVCIGNHDRIIQRKAFSSGLSTIWIKGYSEVLATPKWNFDTEFIYDNVLYRHGEGGKARMQALKRRRSVVQGHWHSESYVDYLVSETDKIFAMQVGCGVNDKSYAMAYAKNFPNKFVIGCGVVLEGGTLPINVLMDL